MEEGAAAQDEHPHSTWEALDPGQTPGSSLVAPFPPFLPFPGNPRAAPRSDSAAGNYHSHGAPRALGEATFRQPRGEGTVHRPGLGGAWPAGRPLLPPLPDRVSVRAPAVAI